MVDVVSMVRFIEQKGKAVEALTPPAEWNDFSLGFQTVARQLHDDGDMQSAEKDLHSLMSRHGTVALLLHDAEPTTFPLPQPVRPSTNQLPKSTSGAPRVQGSAEPGTSKVGEVVRSGNRGEGETPPLPTGTQTALSQASQWTPEQRMSLYKEIVTALFGLIIIGFTSWLAVQTLLYAGNTNKITDAKDILTVMMGLAGTVIGYYFGRVPGDARAAEAGRQANAAAAEAERARATGRAVSQQLDAAITRATTAAAKGAGMDQAQQDQLENLRRARDQLRGVSG
jgi:hypothetical protein